MPCLDRRSRGRIALATVFALASALPSRARAQDGVPAGASGAKVVPADPAPAPSGPVPPKVKKRAEPIYPPDKLAKGEAIGENENGLPFLNAVFKD